MCWFDVAFVRFDLKYVFVDYLFWIICGIFETWIILDCLCLDYLWIA